MSAMVSDGTFTAWASRVFQVFFLAFDTNEGNQITWDEFSTVYNVLFPNPLLYAENCFRGMNTDGNSFITRGIQRVRNRLFHNRRHHRSK